MTQAALACALQVSQGNISHYEKGQGVPPSVAKRLIAYAGSLGHAISFEDIYGPADIIRESGEMLLPDLRPLTKFAS